MRSNVLFLKIYLALCITSFSFLSCSSQKHFIDTSYNGTDFREKSLAIVYPSGITVKYSGDVRNEFGEGATDSLIKVNAIKMYCSVLSERDLFSSVTFGRILNRTDLKIQKLDYRRGHKLRVFLPDSGKSIGIKDAEQTDYVLVLDSAKITSFPIVNVIMVGLVPIPTMPTKPLTLSARYCFWDNSVGKPVAWGMAVGNKNDGPSVNSETWQGAVSNFIQSLLSSPVFSRQ